MADSDVEIYIVTSQATEKENILRECGNKCKNAMPASEGMLAVRLTREEARRMKSDDRVIEVKRDIYKKRKMFYQRIPNNVNYNYALNYCQGRNGDRINRHWYNGDTVGKNCDIAILDTGVDNTHPEFGDRVKKIPNKNNPNSVSDHVALEGSTNGDSFADRDGHGSHVAGTAAGESVGWARGATIYACKVLDDNGGGSDSDIIAWIDFVTEFHKSKSRPTVINMSLGGGGSKPINDAVNRAYNAGVAVITAAGNASEEYHFSNPPFSSEYLQSSPATARGSITVGATNKSNELTSFSASGSRVDIYSPGSNIISAKSSKMTNDPNPSEKYATYSGTSMSCPQVAGVIARVLSGFSKPSNAMTLNNLLKNHFWGPNIPPNLAVNLSIAVPTPNENLNEAQKGQTANIIIPSSKFPNSQSINVSEYSFAEVTRNWIEIVTNNVGTKRNLGDDQGTVIPIPFTFEFYKKSKTSIRVSSNGYMTFRDVGNEPFNVALPDNLVLEGIHPLWDDYDPTNTVDPNTGIYTHGNSDRLVITWYRVTRFGFDTPSTFQAILRKDDSITFQYNSLANGAINSSTVGIQDVSDFTQIHFNGTSVNPSKYTLRSNSAVKLTSTTTTRTTYKAANNFLFDRVFEDSSDEWRVYGIEPKIKNFADFNK